MKFNPVVAGYLAVGIATVGVLWYLSNLVSGAAHRASVALDSAATENGYTNAVAQGNYSLEYAQARHDYAASVGVPVNSLEDWPARDDWYGGAGPVGYSYGSAKYPKKANDESWLTSIAAQF